MGWLVGWLVDWLVWRKECVFDWLWLDGHFLVRLFVCLFFRSLVNISANRMFCNNLVRDRFQTNS